MVDLVNCTRKVLSQSEERLIFWHQVQSTNVLKEHFVIQNLFACPLIMFQADIREGTITTPKYSFQQFKLVQMMSSECYLNLLAVVQEVLSLNLFSAPYSFMAKIAERSKFQIICFQDSANFKIMF